MKMILGICRFAQIKRLANSERGFAMVEVLVALALMGIAGVGFLSSLTTVSKSTITADELSTAGSLAVSQMEYALSQSYDDTNNPPQYALLPSIPDGWSINVLAERLDPETDGISDDDGIQEISIIVRFGSEQISALTSRKVNIAYVP
ncbi:prepilin-type N-terminal cleavage/methylation domain-containing protein [Chloroflexota bacterium]